MSALRDSLSEADFDVLRELSHVGAGHATTMLSAVVGRRRVALSVPRVELLAPERLLSLVGGADVDLVAIELGLDGLLQGRILVAFTRESAQVLATLVVGAPASEADEIGRSALLEVGNIVTSSYLNALAKLVGAPLWPRPPILREGPARAVLGPRARLDGEPAASPGSPGAPGAAPTSATLKQVPEAPTEEGEALVMVNEFAVEPARFIGYFLVFPHPGSLDACLAAAREGA